MAALAIEPGVELFTLVEIVGVGDIEIAVGTEGEAAQFPQLDLSRERMRFQRLAKRLPTEIKDMAGRAREGKIRQNELEGATFQVTNLGMYGVVEFGSIITVPQSASLAVGAVRQVPVVRNGEIVVGEIMNVTLSADHRVVDGAVAAQYLAALRKLPN